MRRNDNWKIAEGGNSLREIVIQVYAFAICNEETMNLLKIKRLLPWPAFLFGERYSLFNEARYQTGHKFYEGSKDELNNIEWKGI